jgi:hypothetical protein
MTNDRFCPTCASRLTQVAGLCPLGHSLEPLMRALSVQQLREEVDRAFDRAMQEVAAVMGGWQSKVGGGPALPPPPPPQEAQSDQRLHRVPPAPPPMTSHPSVWEALKPQAAYLEPATGDPISAFAPAPRMDWGPQRPSLFEWRSRFRGPSSASA